MPSRLSGHRRGILARGAGAAEGLAGLDDARGHGRLGLLAPGARVVLLLVADLAVDLEHAVVVGEHVVGDRAGEGVLRVGVDVHLDDAVVDGCGDLLGSEPEPPWKTRSNGRASSARPLALTTASCACWRISGRSLTLPGL